MISGFLFILASCSKDKYEFRASDSTCDLTNVTYSGNIKQIIEFNCSYSPCHSSPPMDSSLIYDFTDYKGLKSAIGSVYNRINRPVEDPLHMPKGLPGEPMGYAMDPCDLAMLKIWIINGAPDN